MKIKNLVSKNNVQYLIFSYLFAFVTLCCLILYFIDISPFQRFIGNINPFLVIFISFILGLVFHSYLITKTTFVIYKKNNLVTYLSIVGIASLFGLEIISADIWLVDYSSEINILFPKSIFFYPAIAFIVEVLFHSIPISLIIFILSLLKKINIRNIVLISIIVVALIEPLYQIWFTSQSCTITIIYTGIHVFLFSLTQLLIFKHFGFISMYLFRIIFYVIWHILWGYARLELLF